MSDTDTFCQKMEWNGSEYLYYLFFLIKVIENCQSERTLLDFTLIFVNLSVWILGFGSICVSVCAVCAYRKF